MGEGDVLAHELAKMIGIRVAALRFLSPASAEFDVAHRALASAQPDEPEHRKNLLVQFARMRKTGCPLMVMEFVHGDSLQGRLGSEALSRGEKGFMRNLGHVLAMDLLMNNWDRMPALRSWPKAGNLGNVLVVSGGNDGGEGHSYSVVAIDQTAHLLCEPQKRADYYHALRSFVVDEVMMMSQEGGAGGGDSCCLAEEETEGLKRIKKAVQSQVMRWTGEMEKDAETFRQFMIKPDSVQGVVLGGTAFSFLLDGVRDVFSRAGTLRAEFVGKTAALVELTKGYFVEVEGEHHGERIEASVSFIEGCMGTVESDDLYQKRVHDTLADNIVFPGRAFFSTLQCKPEEPNLMMQGAS